MNKAEITVEVFRVRRNGELVFNAEAEYTNKNIDTADLIGYGTSPDLKTAVEDAIGEIFPIATLQCTVTRSGSKPKVVINECEDNDEILWETNILGRYSYLRR